jgi:5-methylthioadenosine/S-adenosylhomocysteine deaminase
MTAPERCDLVVTGDVVLPMTDGLPRLDDAAVAVKDGAIVAIGPRAEVASRWRGEDEIRGGIVLPGLVNCHGHAAMTLYRGLCDDLPLKQWLENFVWPAERAFTTPANVETGTRLAVAEMLASGTTAFADMYFFEEVVGHVCADAGIRVLLGQAVINFPTPDAPSSGASFQKCVDLAQTWKGHPLVRVSMALHAVYTVPPDQLAFGAQEAARLGIPIQIHMSETASEVADCVATHGVRPPALLARTGVLREGTICAHGLHVDEDDLALVRDAKAGISINPESNLKLASGVPDVARYLAAGVRVGLGTDGAASNDDLDLWDAVRLAALLAKGVRGDPTAVPAKEAVRLATRGGAELLGLGAVAGMLEIGRRADLCVIDTRAAHLTPLYDPYAQLAYAVRGSDVLHTVVDGRVVYRDRRHTTIDVPATLAAANSVAGEIARSVGVVR